MITLAYLNSRTLLDRASHVRPVSRRGALMSRLADVGTSIDNTAFVAVMAALLIVVALVSIRDARATCDAIGRQDHAAAIAAGGRCPWCGRRS